MTRCSCRVSQRQFRVPTVSLATPRLPRGGSPAFWRYYETAKTSTSLLHALISFARRYPPWTRCFAHTGREAAADVPGRCSASVVLALAFGGGRKTDLPSSQGTLAPICPALRSRSDLHARHLLWRFDAAPHRMNGEAPTTMHLSGLHHTAFGLAPYASCRPLGSTTQCSLPAGCQPLPGGARFPLGSCIEFQCFHFLSIWAKL